MLRKEELQKEIEAPEMGLHYHARERDSLITFFKVKRGETKV
jgi:hypothetical protein